jgi:hypothetical protein
MVDLYEVARVARSRARQKMAGVSQEDKKDTRAFLALNQPFYVRLTEPLQGPKGGLSRSQNPTRFLARHAGRRKCFVSVSRPVFSPTMNRPSPCRAGRRRPARLDHCHASP